MKQELTGLRQAHGIDSIREAEGLKLVRVPIGTFAGTLERVFVVKDGQTDAFDTGDQAGGQN